jgi:hypothetical protein
MVLFIGFIFFYDLNEPRVVWSADVACLARCGVTEAFPVCPWLATLATTIATTVRPRIPAPQLWCVCWVVVAAHLTGIKH